MASLQDHEMLIGKLPAAIVEQRRRDGTIQTQEDEDRVYAEASREWQRLIGELHGLHEACFEDLDVEVVSRSRTFSVVDLRGEGAALGELAARGVYTSIDAREVEWDPG